MDHIAIPYHVDDSYYPNVGRLGSSGSHPEVQRTYWSNIAVLAASVRRFATSGVQFTVYTNVAPPSDLTAVLDALSVDREALPFRREPPRDFADRYRSSFYLFDVLDHLVAVLESQDRAIILDPDCIFIDSVDRLFDRVDRDGLLVHHIDQAADLTRHGHSRTSLAAIFREETGADVVAPSWIGGELLGFNRATGRQLSELAEDGWQTTLQRYREGRPYFRSDEHLHSYVFWRLGWDRGNADDLMARLYTNTFPLPRTVSDTPEEVEFRYAMWHLPGEKERGLRRLAAETHPDGGRLHRLPLDGYRRYVGEAVGVVPTFRRRVADQMNRARRIPRRLREKLSVLMGTP